MLKTIFKIIWYIVAIVAIMLCLYFLVNGGATDLGALSTENGGFFGGVKQFFINFWEGIKASFSR